MIKCAQLDGHYPEIAPAVRLSRLLTVIHSLLVPYEGALTHCQDARLSAIES